LTSAVGGIADSLRVLACGELHVRQHTTTIDHKPTGFEQGARVAERKTVFALRKKAQAPQDVDSQAQEAFAQESSQEENPLELVIE